MRAIALCLGLLLGSGAWAGWHEDVGKASRMGKGAFCILGYCLYQAELWGNGNPGHYEAPFALVLKYERNITREKLVDTSIDEIRRLARTPISPSTLGRWRVHMQAAFPNVGPGDSLAGVFVPGKGVRFYTNGRFTIQIDDQQFAMAFFDIWLNPETRAESLRKRLLGKEE